MGSVNDCGEYCQEKDSFNYQIFFFFKQILLFKFFVFHDLCVLRPFQVFRQFFFGGEKTSNIYHFNGKTFL